MPARADRKDVNLRQRAHRQRAAPAQRSAMRRAPQFRIPGPAGAPPTQSTQPSPSCATSAASKKRPSPPTSSFTSSAWRAMLHAHRQQPLRSSLALLRRNALLSCRAPLDHLPVLIDSLQPVGDDLSLLVADPTHALRATLHHRALDAQLRTRMQRGVVLVLTDVTATVLVHAISAFARHDAHDVHLIIHRANIKSVFSPSDDVPVVPMPPSTCTSSSQLKKWALEPYSPYAAQPPPVPNVRLPHSVSTAYRAPRPSSSHSVPRPSTSTTRVVSAPRSLPPPYNPSRISTSSRAVQKPFNQPRKRPYSQIANQPIPVPSSVPTTRPNQVPVRNTTPSSHVGSVLSETDLEQILCSMDVDAIVEAKRKDRAVQVPSSTNSVAAADLGPQASSIAPIPTPSHLHVAPRSSLPNASTLVQLPASHRASSRPIHQIGMAPAKPNLSALDEKTMDALFE